MLRAGKTYAADSKAPTPQTLRRRLVGAAKRPCGLRPRGRLNPRPRRETHELRSSRLGSTAPAGHRLPRHFAGTAVAEIGLLGTAPRIREINPHHSPFGLLDFLAAIVADQPRYTCH